MKKIASIILGATLILLGCSKTDDFPEVNNDDLQLKSADSRTINFRFSPAADQWNTPVYCDGELVDELAGDGESLLTHAVMHFKDGKAKWGNIIVNGTIKSETTGEIFKINEINKLVFDENEEIINHTCRTHASGNKGTQVIMFFYIPDFSAGIFELEKAVCASNSEDE